MAGVHRQGDMTAGHGCWPPTTPASWSTTVFCNDKGVVRKGDGIVPHTCPAIPETHDGVYTDSTTVFADDLPVQKIGSPISCDDQSGTGSSDCFIED